MTGDFLFLSLYAESASGEISLNGQNEQKKRLQQQTFNVAVSSHKRSEPVQDEMLSDTKHSSLKGWLCKVGTSALTND